MATEEDTIRRLLNLPIVEPEYDGTEIQSWLHTASPEELKAFGDDLGQFLKRIDFCPKGEGLIPDPLEEQKTEVLTIYVIAMVKTYLLKRLQSRAQGGCSHGD